MLLNCCSRENTPLPKSAKIAALPVWLILVLFSENTLENHLPKYESERIAPVSSSAHLLGQNLHQACLF
jgi:hypothetical protein